MDSIQEFITYRQSIGDRKQLYQCVTELFKVQIALYPGSHIDIMPSFVIPKAIYVDSYKGTNQFFESMDSIRQYVHLNKVYKENAEIVFIAGDYNILHDIEQVDLIISQFAGFVGQATKAHLKDGGILLCNDSHGDATLAYCDSDFEFIGVVNIQNMVEIENLEQYFKFARSRDIDVDKVRSTMKGPNYKYKAGNYIFRKKQR